MVLGERPAHYPDSLIPPYNVSKGNEADHSVPAWVVDTLPQKIFVSRVTRRDTMDLGDLPFTIFLCMCMLGTNSQGLELLLVLLLKFISESEGYFLNMFRYSEGKNYKSNSTYELCY